MLTPSARVFALDVMQPDKITDKQKMELMAHFKNLVTAQLLICKSRF